MSDPYVVGRQFKNINKGSVWTIAEVDPDNDLIVATNVDSGKKIGLSISHFDQYYTFIDNDQLSLPIGEFQDFLEDTGLDIRCIKCECGVDTLGEGHHSSWCPKSGVKNG